jgi:signal transduction histidine kinase
LAVIPSNNSEKTEILCGLENVMDLLLRFVFKSKTISSCGDSKASSLLEVKEYGELLSNLKNRDIKIRYITDITKDNLAYCKEMVNFNIEIRHLEGIRANFSVSESEYLASSTSIQESGQPKPIQQVIYSNVKDIVEQQKYVFESFWDRAILGEQRIKEIEEGKTFGKTEIIQIPSKTKELFIELVNSAKEEILLLLPTINSFLRENRMGIMHSLKVKSINENIKIHILTPTDGVVNKILLDLGVDDKNNFILTPIEFTSDQIDVSSVTILVVDKKESLVIEKTDDSKKDFMDAIGLSTYSTSNPTVMSYTSIFKSIISQVKLFEQLKTHGKMQEEFINIASHELRTPTQAILTYSELLQHHSGRRDEMILAIKRNAIRLQKLTEDILDVTKIESKTLNLHKEKLNLGNLLSTTIDDYRNNDNGEVKIRLVCTDANREHFLVEVDYERIVQVLSNLLDNAIKFTKEEKGGGDVYVFAEKKTKHNSQEIIVRIKDTGQGIDSEIMPRLFTKFVTKSTKGTGLGLFICMGIIVAHGGTIWAENNEDGKGATFSFSLPIKD